MEDGSKVKYNLYSKEYYEKLNVPFTIEAAEYGTTVYFRQSSYAVNDGIDPLSVEVSTDNGETWTEVTAAPSENNVPGAILAELNNGEKVLIRGKNDAYGYYSSENYDDTFDNCNFWADSSCYVYGNIMSLVGGDDFARLRKVNEYAFAYFFSDSDESLDWSWVLSKQGEELLLPATTLADNCYFYMFRNCTSLTTAPALPATTLTNSCYSAMFAGCTSLITAPKLTATTLVNYCYGNMFENCTSLTTTPELPATTLADSCYSFMFNGCTKLTTIPELPATTLADSCYYSMFGNCTNLTVAPELPATTLANNCYQLMFKNCTYLITAPELPATTLARRCYHSMFTNCTSLVIAPELPAITLADFCYGSMFNGCYSLSYINAMFTTTPGSSYTSNWVKDVKATGTFVKNAEATWNVTGNNGVPTGWTVETASS